GRQLRAFRPGRSRALTFLRRDAVGAFRTPLRLLRAVSLAALAGVLITLATIPSVPGPFLAGVSALLAYTSTATIGQGLKYAGTASGDLPVYGVSDRVLVLLHTQFPVACMLTILSITTVATALLTSIGVGFAVFAGWMIGL